MSHHSVCVNYRMIWISVFFAILGSVNSCAFWDYHDIDDEPFAPPRNFLTDLERAIKTTNDGNEMKIIEMLASQNKSQLLKIADCYNDCYKRNLISDLKNKFTGKLEQIVVALVIPEMQYTVRSIHDALVGVESDSCALIDILCTQDNKNLEQIKIAYEKMYHDRLISHLERYNSGLLKKLLLAVTKWRRDENTGNNKIFAQMDAQKLKFGDDLFSNDRALMGNILITGSFSRIRRALYRYHDLYNEFYESKISQNYGGDVKRALFTIVRWSKGRDQFYAEKLRNSLNFDQTDDHSLIRTIIYNIDNMEPIKKEFRRRYSITLEKAIREKIVGSYAEALILLINKGKKMGETSISSTESEKNTMCYWC